MPDTGLLYATAATTGVYESGLFLWTNPSNITGNDNAYTESHASLIAGNTHYIFPTFTHDISAGYTIDGIVAGIDRYAGNDNGNGASDKVVSLYINNVVVGDNKAGGAWPLTRTWSSDYGGPTDLWGTSISPTDTIGLAISADFDGSKDDVFIYNVRMTIYYSTGGGSSGTYNIFSGESAGSYYKIIEAA